MILEAFTNAAMAKNDNSSRAMTALKLGFTADGICGSASYTAALLDKGRITYQAPGERNFHVFYQLLAGAGEELRQQLHLSPVLDYVYLNNGDPGFTSHAMHAAEQFQVLRTAMSAVGFAEDTQQQILRTLSATLMMGNLSFVTTAMGEDLSNSPALDLLADLLGVDKRELKESLLAPTRAAGARGVTGDAVRDYAAKALYEELVTSVVVTINATITEQFADGTADASTHCYTHTYTYTHVCTHYVSPL